MLRGKERENEETEDKHCGLGLYFHSADALMYDGIHCGFMPTS